MAEDKLAEDKKKLAAERDARVKVAAEQKKLVGRPTPTQEEADLIKLGHHPELETDGSEDPAAAATKHLESEGGRPYQTRQVTGGTAGRHTESK